MTHLYAATSAAFAATLLAGCVTSDISPHDPALGSAMIGLKGPDVAPAADWWRSLNDPQLDRIMGDALAGNPTLDVALARLRLAGAGIEATRAGLLPRVGIDAEEDRSRLSGAYIIPPPYAGTDRWLGSTQASLSWTLDFAGRQSALIRQARQSAEAAGLDRAAARVALTGAVAETYVGLTRAELQMRIAGAFTESREMSLALARTRQANNLSSDFDIRAAETLLAEAERSLDKAKGERALMTHALAALAGRGADAYADIAPRRSASKRPCRCPRPCRPTCSTAGPTFWRPGRGSQRPAPAAKRPGPTSIRASTCARFWAPPPSA